MEILVILGACITGLTLCATLGIWLCCDEEE